MCNGMLSILCMNLKVVIIYMQYHSERWGMLSTDKMAAYFDVRILPTMESRVSPPQLGYFSASVLELMVYLD